MGYTPNLQFLAPGATMMPRANTIPYGQLLENKKWREEAKDTLALNQNLLNSAFEDVRATNENDASILDQKNKYYSTKRDEILNDPKMNTREKYRAMNILGTEAANDQELATIRKFTEGYQTNKKLLEESINLMDEDVYRATMDRLEEQNRMGIGQPGPYMAGNTFNTIKGIETPDQAKDAKEYLTGMSPNTTITSKSKVDGTTVVLQKGADGKFYNMITKEEVTFDEAADIAKGYILQSPKYQEFFALKDAGAEANLRTQLAREGKTDYEIDTEIQRRKDIYGGTVYDKDLYIEQGIRPGAQYVDYNKEVAQIRNNPDQAKATAKAESGEEKIKDAPILYDFSTMGATDLDKKDLIQDQSDYERRVADLTTKLNEANQQLLDVESGRITKTNQEIKNIKFQASKAQADLENIESSKSIYVNNEIEKGTFAGNRFKDLQDYKNINIVDEAGNIDIWGGKGDYVMPETNETYKQYVSHSVAGRDYDELGELKRNLEQGDGNAWNAFSPFIKDIYAPNLEDERVEIMFRRAMNFYPNARKMILISSPDKKSEELEKAYKQVMGAELTTNKKQREKITGALSNINQPGEANIVYKELVKNGKPEEEARALVKMLEGFDNTTDLRNLDIDSFLKNGVERTVSATTNYFNNYLNENKEGLMPKAPRVVQLSDSSDTKIKTDKSNIVKGINLQDFVVADFNTDELLEEEDFENVTINDVVAVGMEELYFGEGEEQRIPIIVTGTQQVGKETKPVKYTLYGDRAANKNTYWGISDYLGKAGFVDPSNEDRFDKVTGERIPNTDKSMVQFTQDLLKNEHTIDQTFEQKVNNTPVQGTGELSFGTFAGVQSVRLQNGEVMKQVKPNTVKLKFVKTGQNNYKFNNDVTSNPILQMRKGMIDQIPGFDKLLDSLPNSMREVNAEGMTPEQISMTQSLITMNNSYKVLKNNDFKVDLDSEVEAKLYLRRLQQVYNSMYNNMNTDINNYYKVAELLTR